MIHGLENLWHGNEFTKAHNCSKGEEKKYKKGNFEMILQFSLKQSKMETYM